MIGTCHHGNTDIFTSGGRGKRGWSKEGQMRRGGGREGWKGTETKEKGRGR